MIRLCRMIKSSNGPSGGSSCLEGLALVEELQVDAGLGVDHSDQSA